LLDFNFLREEDVKFFYFRSKGGHLVERIIPIKYLGWYYTPAMSKILFCSLLIGLLSFQKIYSQSFEAGYVVTLQNDTLRGFIRTNEYGATSRTIGFKKLLTDTDHTRFLPIQIKSFYLKEVGEIYVSKIVDIDMKPVRFQDLEHNSAAKFVKDTVFLKLLVSGKSSLYFNSDRTNKNHYFLQMDGVDVYREQLAQYLNGCDQKYSNLGFAESEFKKVVVKYNECVGSKSTFIQKDTKSKLLLYIMLGGSATTGTYSGNDNHPELVNASSIKFSSGFSPSLGFGMEFKPTKSTQHFSEGIELFWKEYSFTGTTTNFNAQKTASYSFSTTGLNLFGKYSFGGKIEPYIRVGLSATLVSESKNQMYYTSDIAYSSWNGKISNFGSLGYGYLIGAGVSVSRIFIELRLNEAVAFSSHSKFSTTSLNFIVGYRIGK
jgi:hypothetical protein